MQNEGAGCALIVGLAAASILVFVWGFDGTLARNSAAEIHHEDLPGFLTGVVIALENAGPAPITEAALGFDLPPNDPGQQLEVVFGDPGSPANLGELQFKGSPVSRTNPLPPDEVACIGPLSEIVPGTEVEFEQVAWFGNGFGGLFTHLIFVDESTLPFDWEHAAVPGGRLSGTWRFLSTVPPECEGGDSSSSAATTVTPGWASLPYPGPRRGDRFTLRCSS